MKTQQTTRSEVRLVYRTKIKASNRVQVKCSKDAFDIFLENWAQDSIEHIEEFKLMLLTRSNRVLGIASKQIKRSYIFSLRSDKNSYISQVSCCRMV